jgi:hypothetical protein
MFALNKLASLEKLEQKSLNLINDIVFLNRCKSLNLVPKGTRIKDPWTDIPKSQQPFDTLERKMLTLIKKTNFNLLTSFKKKSQNIISLLEQKDLTLYQTMGSYIEESINKDKKYIKET